jgi:maltooligosyltrehalose trehalohydrolase
MQARLPYPGDPQTFLRCKLDLAEREQDDNGKTLALYRDLLRLRKKDPVLSGARARRDDGAVLGKEAFLLRIFADPSALEQSDRLLFVNLGRELRFSPCPEPLFAPPLGMHWELLFSSEDPRYGGSGTAPLEREGGFFVPGHAAVLLCAVFTLEADPEAPTAPSIKVDPDPEEEREVRDVRDVKDG